MNYQDFDKHIRALSEDIFAECGTDQDRAHDLSYESADSSELVIYTGKAWDLCDYMRFNESNIYWEAHSDFEDCGGLKDCESMDDAITRIAFYIVHNAVREAVDTLIEQEG